MSKSQKTSTVTFLPANKTIAVKNGSTLIEAARKAGIHVNASCGGAGVCGKCRVILEQGMVTGGRKRKALNC